MMGDVNIRCGIFQGDSLSPLLFVVCLIPLSLILRKTKGKYQLSKEGESINHLLFMDDLKLFGSDEWQVDSLINTVCVFSDDNNNNNSGCEVSAKTEYISRHDKAAAYLHWNICQDHDIEVIDKWYKHKPESVTHNKITIMWDMPVNTDRTITANRPDIIIKDSVNSTCKLIIPSERNIALKEIEKKSKYKDLELEIQRMWQMKTEVIPVVVGALGTIKKGMIENIKRVSERANVTETQKISMLGSARILRKVLNV